MRTLPPARGRFGGGSSVHDRRFQFLRFQLFHGFNLCIFFIFAVSTQNGFILAGFSFFSALSRRSEVAVRSQTPGSGSWLTLLLASGRFGGGGGGSGGVSYLFYLFAVSTFAVSTFAISTFSLYTFAVLTLAVSFFSQRGSVSEKQQPSNGTPG